jgi:2-isopropylmalate synthase
MNRIRIADVTIKESCNSAKSTLSFKEKMEVAKQLDLLMTDVIEMPKAVGQTESLLVKSLAPVIKNSVLSVDAGLDRDEVDKAMAALANAKKPRICISVPTSPVQMEYVCGMKPKKILELVPAIVSYAKTLCPEVEFSCKDATRSEKDFLCQVILSAVKAGATLVDLEDTAGVMLPEEFDSLMDAIFAMLKEEGENVAISVTCSDNLNMATANAVTCIRSGAVEVKTSLIGKAAPRLEAIVNMVTERGDSLEMEIAQKRPEVEKTLRKLFWMEGSRSGGTDIFEKEEPRHEDLDLDENADISKVIRAIKKLGYELSDDDNAKVYKEFKRVSEKKKVGAKEMEAIIATASLQVAPTYQLVNFVINSGNIITPTAQVTLEKDGNQLKGLSSGDGPIAAAFLAVEMVVGVHYELDDFQIQSVTEGSEAVGNALVKLRYNGKLYSGNGISTDIIGASIRAYLNAINKIVFDSKNE